MTISEKQLAEWEALVPKLNDDADDHMDVAHSVDMRPEHTANYRHAKNAHEAAYAIHSLIAELREAREQLAKAENRANLISNNLKFERELHAKTEAELAEAEKDASNMRKILKLTECEGEEVVVVYPNPEPLDPSKNFAILVSKDYGDTLTPYHAESLTACLDAAIAAQEKS